MDGSRRVALCGTLVVLASPAGLAACGGSDPPDRPAAVSTSAPAATPERRVQLTPGERREARRALKRLRKGSKTPRSVVSDSGVIP